MINNPYCILNFGIYWNLLKLFIEIYIHKMYLMLTIAIERERERERES